MAEGEAKEQDVDEMLIIGNGFDLACGLKSSYKDFFEYRYKINEENNIYNYFKNIFDNPTKQPPDYLNYHLFDFILIALHQLEDQKKLEDIQWKDIESLIKLVLSEDFSLSLKQLFIIKLSDIDKAYDKADDQAVTEESFKKTGLEGELLTRYARFYSYYKTIDNSETEDKIRFKLLYFLNPKLISSSSISNKLSDLQMDFNKLVSLFYDSVASIENSFEAYLNMLLKNPNNTSDIKDILNQTQTEGYSKTAELLFKVLLGNENIWFNKYILSFNYTSNTLNKFYAYNNVHGKINNGTPHLSNIIFGIDENNNNDLYARQFTKTYKKLFYDSRNNINNGKKIILPKSIKTIKFFGHSLTEADYSYFQSIFDFYDIYHSNVDLIFVYSKLNENSLADQLSAIDKLFETYGQTLDNKNHGKNLLHKLQLEGRLEIIEIDEMAKRNKAHS